MQRQSIKVHDNRHVTQNENHALDWPLMLGIIGALGLAAVLIWGIATALGL